MNNYTKNISTQRTQSIRLLQHHYSMCWMRNDDIDEMKLDRLSTLRILVAKSGKTLNSLTARSTLTTGKCPVTANSIAAQLVQNGRFPNHDREFTGQVSKEYTSLWRSQSVDTDLARDFSGPDNIHAEFLIHAGDHAKEWLRKFFNKCLLTCELQRICRSKGYCYRYT